MHDEPQKAALGVGNLAKRYAGGAGVGDVSLSVPPGSITGFIGANGAGKSTTLRCIMGLLRPDSGTVRLFGQPSNHVSRRQVGFLPEERGIAPRERARDAIAFHARLKGVERREALRRADRLLERIGLGDRCSARVGELSKGNAQRVQILCALAHEPQLLILDEPLSGLDPIGQAEVLSLFAELKARGVAVLFSTHAMGAAQSACDRVVMIAGGRTVFEGPLQEATERAPHGAVVVTPDAAALQAAAQSLGAEVRPVVIGGVGQAERWRVMLPKTVPHPALVRALAQHSVAVFALEPIKADLEGAFWHLADGRPAQSHAA